MMIYINNTIFVLILRLEKDHSMNGTSHLKKNTAFFSNYYKFFAVKKRYRLT